jgi:penicillin-binding protein 1A
MVRGRGYEESPYNRAVDSRRQRARRTKPFVYAAALDSYYSGARLLHSTAQDEPDIPDKQGVVPENCENSYAGQVTVARAVARSLNVATVKLSGGWACPR